jgi:hypothetical protein
MSPSDRIWRERGLRSAVLACDERAWQILYEESFAALTAYVAWRCAGLRDLEEEIIQDTWLVAVKRIRSFDPECGSFTQWLRGIANNLLCNQVPPSAAAQDDAEAKTQKENFSLMRPEIDHRSARYLRPTPWRKPLRHLGEYLLPLSLFHHPSNRRGCRTRPFYLSLPCLGPISCPAFSPCGA